MAAITPAKDLFDLTGQVALVTGASSGLGARFAEVLAAHGAKVIAAARRTDRLEALAAGSPNIATLALDVTDGGGMAAALDAAERAFGPLTLLVNNAGIAGGGRILDADPEDWRRVQDVNVDAVWNLSQGFARRAIARQAAGAIINVASMVSYRVGASSASYAISKAAVLHMTKAMALEWAPHRIRVNTLCPTFIRTPLAEQTLAIPERKAWILSKIKLGRVGEIEDLMGPVVFLASDASALMTGTHLIIDGGWTAE